MSEAAAVRAREKGTDERRAAPEAPVPKGEAAPSEADAVLAAEHLHLRHPGADRDAVRDVHLAVRPGELLCMVGPNGSGKSTTLAALGRSLRPRRGTVRLDGRDAWSTSRREYARRVARLPQEPHCPEGLTVEELVHGGRNPHRSFLGPWRGEDRDAVHEALVWMDLQDLRRRTVETLSGGERRRAWLAMVLCQRAEILLLDEPTAGLDLRHAWEVLDRLQQIRRERGTAVVVVLHDLDRALACADRVAVFLRGRLYASGAPLSILDPETLADVFAVESSLWIGRDGACRIDVHGPMDPLRSL